MTMREVLAGIPIAGASASAAFESSSDRPVEGIEYDSRRVGNNYLFFAFPGVKADGRQFAREALERGAAAVVSDSPAPAGFAGPWIQVDHGRRSLALACRRFFAGLAERLVFTGITGTNGKTTTSYLADAVLRAGGIRTALIGTIEYRVGGEVLPAVNTTPESLDLYRLFRRLDQAGGTHVTMEVSSHALALGRVHGLRFDTAVFTNLTRDHLDFHGTMEEYFAAKRALFEGQAANPPRVAVLNQDDARVKNLSVPRGVETIQFGLSEDADLRATAVEEGFDGLRFQASWRGKRRAVTSPLMGRINVYNILAAYGAGVAHGLDPEAILAGIASLTAVPGRFERIDQGQPFLVVVDYAHTPDALRNALAAARSLEPRRVITVFGCGGDRDRAKRPLMGEAAAAASDFVVLTSDNPRSEDPLAIINDAVVGLRRHDVKHVLEPDREAAIRLALAESGAGDLVLIAGKGHERTQVLRDGTIPFDDREVARRWLRESGYAGRRR